MLLCLLFFCFSRYILTFTFLLLAGQINHVDYGVSPPSLTVLTPAGHEVSTELSRVSRVLEEEEEEDESEGDGSCSLSMVTDDEDAGSD